MMSFGVFPATRQNLDCAPFYPSRPHGNILPRSDAVALAGKWAGRILTVLLFVPI